MTQSEFSQQASALTPLLRQFAMRYTNDNEDANDLIQDTMMKAIKYYAQFEPGSNLKAWLFTILKNTFINNYRKKTKANALITQNDEISSVDLSYSASRNEAEGTFIMKDIRKAIDTLPESYAKPFISFFEGYKYHEIAEELNIPIGTVKTRIHVARTLLKDYLKSYAKYNYKTGVA
ncbi:RNA polymerase sigma factor [Pedobacter sandarakinus]|uniref:RNA polymerase sigma factor n=1 Tax=Pedobacter sandarakinus TaxID=353156 RepID=UPI0022481E41|nr:sigma-70 family RNA polymerase sigma factor [Pedobacter sandarakinus]MCX2574776.1 sigma-70 family RNA polymerase sigma factor [Pedobacter sandarakinus]